MALQAKRPRRVTFNFRAANRKSRRAETRAFDIVAKRMEARLQKSLSIPYPPPSRAGQSPHRRTGYLRGHTKVTRRGRSIFAHVPQYGIWLDGGTRRMAARPFIRKNIHDQRKKWEHMVAQEYRKARS